MIIGRVFLPDLSHVEQQTVSFFDFFFPLGRVEIKDNMSRHIQQISDRKRNLMS